LKKVFVAGLLACFVFGSLLALMIIVNTMAAEPKLLRNLQLREQLLIFTGFPFNHDKAFGFIGEP